jgi:hypothetical protein
MIEAASPRASTTVSAMALRKSFNTAYNYIPLGANG